MPDIRSLKDVLDLEPVKNLKYEVAVNNSYGFKVNLSWFYESDLSSKIIGFKLYKIVSSKNLLNKKYAITQKVLETTTAAANMTAMSNILYDKSAFLQTEKVKFDNSNSSKFDKQDVGDEGFRSIAFINVNSNRLFNDYSFTDKNIKFGETYSYYVSAVSNTLKETIAVPINVNIEFLDHPPSPDFFSASETNQGILLIFGNRIKKNISQYLIFRKTELEKDFTLLDVVDANSSFVYYSDLFIEIKERYIYKIYSRDIWGNLSLDSKTLKQSFSYIPRFTSAKNKPTVLFYPQSIGFKLVIKNEIPEIKSVRIERRDDWRFERTFEVKSFDGFPNSNNYFFENGVVEFLDKTFEKNRAYSYRITCFNQSGHALNYLVTPSISKDEVFKNEEFGKASETESKISSFNFSVVNKNQKNIFVKFNWKIAGRWSYLILNDGNREIRIESLHSRSFISGFFSGKKYQISVSLFDENDKKIDFKENMELNL